MGAGLERPCHVGQVSHFAGGPNIVGGEATSRGDAVAVVTACSFMGCATYYVNNGRRGFGFFWWVRRCDCWRGGGIRGFGLRGFAILQSRRRRCCFGTDGHAILIAVDVHQLHAQALATLAVTLPTEAIAAVACHGIRAVGSRHPGSTVVAASSLVVDQPGGGAIVQVLDGWKLSLLLLVLAARRHWGDRRRLIGTSQERFRRRDRAATDDATGCHQTLGLTDCEPPCPTRGTGALLATTIKGHDLIGGVVFETNGARSRHGRRHGSRHTASGGLVSPTK